jgi:hypothetical protein
MGLPSATFFLAALLEIIATPRTQKAHGVVGMHSARQSDNGTPAPGQDDSLDDFTDEMNAALGKLRAGIALDFENHSIYSMRRSEVIRRLGLSEVL